MSARAAVSARIASHFASRFEREYVKWKLRTDPLYDALAGLLKKDNLPVLDIGCGRGLLAFHLREHGVTNAITGLDFDARKIHAARKVAVHYPPSPEFHITAVCQPWPAVAGHVCLLDVLQYLPDEDQLQLLTKASAHVATDGLLIIRTGLRGEGWRQRITVLTDHLMAWTRMMKSRPLSYPTRPAIQNALGAAGLQPLDARPLSEGTPFNNHLLVFSKVTETGSSNVRQDAAVAV